MSCFTPKSASMLGVAAFGFVCLLAGPARAELIVGLTGDQSIVTFDSLTPSATTLPVPVTGLMSNHSLVGIDRRPSLGPNNGLLYGVAFNVASFSDFGIYTINSITAVATLALIATPPYLLWLRRSWRRFQSRRGSAAHRDQRCVPQFQSELPRQRRYGRNCGRQYRSVCSR